MGRSWKSKEAEVIYLCKQDTSAFSDAIKDIMIKIMLIPANKQKSADELILIFLKIYDVLNRHFTGHSGEDRLRSLY